MPVVSRRSPKTEQQNLWAVNAFLSAAGRRDAYSEAEVTKAIEKLERRYAPKSVSYIFTTCKRLLNLPKGLVYRFDQSSVEQVMVKRDALIKMIKAVKDDDPLLRTYLLLSTLYGLRCGELALVEPNDIDGDTFFVRTTKFGIQKKQLIPESVRGLLEGVDIRPVSRKTATTAFLLIENLAGIEHRRKAGWHSIRRALATGLAENGADPTIAKSFMRWKDVGMYQHYVVFDRDIDRRIFQVHPFLSLWEEA